MDCAVVLGVLADLAQVLTGIVAVSAFFLYLRQRQDRRAKLEKYLAAERWEDKTEGRNGARSVLHLMGKLAMTEQEVLAAAFGSKAIKTWVGTDEEGRADRLLFQFVEISSRS